MEKSRWPSLLVIPDVFNNSMILKEAKTVGLPVIGLVNSNCSMEIEYPIFAQNQTGESIHFFCQFLASLIVKETLFFQHKRYTLQKIKQKTKPLPTEKQAKLLTWRKKYKDLQLGKDTWKKPFFFKVVRPWLKRRSRRYWVALNETKPFDVNYKDEWKQWVGKKGKKRRKLIFRTWLIAAWQKKRKLKPQSQKDYSFSQKMKKAKKAATSINTKWDEDYFQLQSFRRNSTQFFCPRDFKIF